MKFPVISNLKNPIYFLTFLGGAIIIFDLNYYIMTKLPGTEDEMCVMGAGFTFENIIFSVLVSLLVGLIISGFVSLFVETSGAGGAGVASLSGLGFLGGSLTIFCPLCTIPALSLGMSVSLGLFTDYNLGIKGISLGLLILSLYLLNKRISKQCALCDSRIV